MRTANRLDWLVAAITCVIVGLAYIRYVGNRLFGSDTGPWLPSSRVSGTFDLLGLAFWPIMPRRRLAAEGGALLSPR